MSDFKYTLTRFCLRSGRLTLPQSMRELFPSQGELKVRDALRGEDFTVTLQAPRTVAGLRGFLDHHQLEVNDEILIRLQDDGQLAFSALPHPRRQGSEGVSQHLLDLVYDYDTPLSEAEIRELQPEASRGLELASLLADDPRFILKDGRWRRAAAPPEEATATPEPPRRLRPGRDAQKASSKRHSVTPYPRGVIFPGDSGLNSARQGGDLSQQQRVKNLLALLGFRVEGLAHAQLLAHADLGRKHFAVLVHLLEEQGRLEWPALTARRREVGAAYAAVFGHDLDLIPQEGQAQLARVSLWSWAAIGRLETMLEQVPLSPADLETHFEGDGLFGKGLERFERTVYQRLAERGVFSAVLTRLATMRAPTLFMLDDVTDHELSREQVLKVLELLAQAPFHLVSKVDSGEFCLRFKVAEALERTSEYALSLHSRLPTRRTERLQSADEGAAKREVIEDRSAFAEDAEPD